MKTYKILITIIVLFSIVFCHSSNIVKHHTLNKKDSCQIEVSFKEKKYTFNSKENKFVTILLTNISDSTIMVPDIIRQNYLSLEITDIYFEVKKLRKCKFENIDRVEENVNINPGIYSNIPTFTILPSKGTKEVIHRVDLFYAMSSKGHYKVRAVFKASKYYKCNDITTSWIDVFVK